MFRETERHQSFPCVIHINIEINNRSHRVNRLKMGFIFLALRILTSGTDWCSISVPGPPRITHDRKQPLWIDLINQGPRRPAHCFLCYIPEVFHQITPKTDSLILNICDENRIRLPDVSCIWDGAGLFSAWVAITQSVYLAVPGLYTQPRSDRTK